MHVIGVPQIAPVFGVGTGNVIFDGPGPRRGLRPGAGHRRLRRIATSSAPHRCATSRCSRPSSTTAPSRGSRTPSGTTSTSSRRRATTTPPRPASTRDLQAPPRADRARPRADRPAPRDAHRPHRARSSTPWSRSFAHGLLDERARRQDLCRLVPAHVPSGFPTMRFEECPQRGAERR